MQNLILPTSQLFYQIGSLRNKLTDSERKGLKKLVIIDYQPIFDIAQQYNDGKLNESQFQQELITLCRETDIKMDDNDYRKKTVNQAYDYEAAQQLAEQSEQNPDIPEEISSPLGAQLWRRRREQRQKLQQQQKK